jgi:hypothetical protein
MATLCASLTQLGAEVDAAYPDRDKASDGWIADANHPSTSDHQPDADGVVHAIDIDENLSPELGSLALLGEHLRSTRDPRMLYAIYEGRILRSYPKPELNLLAWEWGAYTGTDPHSGHMHISANRDLAEDGSTWGVTREVLSGVEETLTAADKQWISDEIARQLATLPIPEPGITTSDVEEAVRTVLRDGVG